MFVGEVLDGARHGDDVAVVWAPVGREPVALANLTAQYLQLHGSADPDTPEGKLPTAFLVAVDLLPDIRAIANWNFPPLNGRRRKTHEA